MQIRGLRWLSLAVMVGVVGVVGGMGCGRSGGVEDRKEGRHPKIQEAERRERVSDFQGAIEAYEEALMQDPGLAKAHLQLGLLYDEHREDYLRALYHYQKYVQLRPESDKAELVRELSDHAKLSFAASLPERPSEAIRRIAILERDVATLEQDLGAARLRIAELQQALQASRQALEQARARKAEVGLATSEGPRTAASAARTYEVRSGDNLSRIASIVYNDSSKWRAIFQANRDVLKRPEDLSPGQVLRIPND